ncbi:MAG: hypothetical protein BroJett029_40160 [Alphaproteobacteria bacterium]|nr:MAG: hypothetical protein BroJett029_40160 [Alphaproteobacteria bacterium]
MLQAHAGRAGSGHEGARQLLGTGFVAVDDERELADGLHAGAKVARNGGFRQFNLAAMEYLLTTDGTDFTDHADVAEWDSHKRHKSRMACLVPLVLFVAIQPRTICVIREIRAIRG